MTTHLRTCHLCEVMCGLAIEVDEGRIGAVRGDDDDVLSHGHICPKGVAIGELHHDPDRLQRPLRRTGSAWSEVGWEEALAEASERLRALRERHGKRSVGIYFGNPVVHNTGALLGGQFLARAIRTLSRFSASTVDQMPKQVSNRLLYGHQLLFPIPDVDRTDLLVILGANPLASNGSLLSAPGIRARLRGIRDRGGRVVLVDPRRTETAKVADEHHFIRPGTDAFLLAAVARELLGEGTAGWQDDRIPTRNAERLRPLLAPFTPAVAAERTGIPAGAIQALARDLANTPRSVVYGRIGTCAQAYGTLTSWLVDVVNLLAGSLDREGGALFSEPPIDLTATDALAGPGSHGRWASRVRGAPEVNGELPVATLAEEITEPGDERIRALITVGGNPALSAPGSEALDGALAQLDFMVSVDPYLNETTRHAHLILPPASSLTNGHYDVVFGHVAVRHVARWSPPVVPAAPDTRSDYAILTDLAVRIGRGRLPWRRQLVQRAARRLGEERLLDLMLRTGPFGWRTPHRLSLRKVAAHPHGLDLGPLQPGLVRRMRVDALDLAPELITDELGRLSADLDAAPARLVLIGRRQLRSNNSWMHNQPSLVKGRDRCTLLVHPDDAAAFGLADGQPATVTSAAGTVTAPVQVSDEVMPGVVSLPHGWGHDKEGTRLKVAREHPGVNVNVLTDPAVLDRPSGTAVLNGVPVQVAPVTGAAPG